MMALRPFMIAAFALCVSACATAPPPSAPADWLNERRGERALAWVRAQNERTLATLGSYPQFESIRARALSFYTDQESNTVPAPSVQGPWIDTLDRSDAHPRGIWRRTSLATYLSGRPVWSDVLDLDELSAREGRAWDIQSRFIKCAAPQFSLCLVPFTISGAQTRTYRLYDVERRAFAEVGFDIPEGVNSIDWYDAQSVLLVHDEPGAAGTAGAQSLRVLRRGQVFSDSTLVLRAPDALIALYPSESATTSDGPLLVALLARDSGAVRAFMSRERDNSWRELPIPTGATLYGLADGLVVFGLSQDAIVLGRPYSAGSVLGLRLDWESFDGDDVVSLVSVEPRLLPEYSAQLSGSLLLVTSTFDQATAFRVSRSGDAWRVDALDLPEGGRIDAVSVSSSGNGAILVHESYADPPRQYFVSNLGRMTPVGGVDASERLPVHVEQRVARSADGVDVPYTIVRSERPTTHRSPTLLHAYGWGGVSEIPHFSRALYEFWLREGGVYVVAHVRGGSEMGPDWHVRGIERRHTYDDFLAVADALIADGVTTSAQLGIHGLSGGGTLMGVALNERPDLFNAAIVEVGAVDLVEPGPALVHIFEHEFGRLDDPVERTFLDDTSPLQNLRPTGAAFAPLMTTTTSDENVFPGGPRRYAARLEGLGRPFLFYEAPEGGHGMFYDPASHALWNAIFYSYLQSQLMR